MPRSDSSGPQPATARAARGPAAQPRVGQKVRVNNYFGIIRRVITHLQVADDLLPDQPQSIPLRSPLYEVELDRRKRVGWVAHARQVHLPPDKTSHRLFRDEFDLVS